ncbi:MAG: hypothetical protein ACRD9S_14920 [Pyrinomonadaceae bacterium]
MSQLLPPEGKKENENRSEVDLNTPGMNPSTEAGAGPGSGLVGTVGIVALCVYLVVFTLLLIYGLVVVWPVPTPSRERADANPAPTPTATATSTPTATATPATTPTPAAGQTPASTPTPTATPPRTGGAATGGQASPSPSTGPAPTASPQPEPVAVSFFGWSFKLWDEQRLLLLVLLAGALGSILHDLRSVYWYVGNRRLVKSWLAMYVVLPFAGATLALVFYLVVRGGFFSPQSSFKETSPFGFAAFAALIGMFSPQAVLKLREVAETLLSKPEAGANSHPQEALNPGAPTPPKKP